jgi:hypothetical protein
MNLCKLGPSNIMSMLARSLLGLLFFLLAFVCCAQNADSATAIPTTARQRDLAPIREVDSLYIMKFTRPNNVRLFYGTHGSALQYGSRRQSNPGISTEKFSNVNDFVGFGVTYKIIDADIAFSLPATRFVQQDFQNLTQFKLALGITRRKYTLRGFYTDSKGMIAGDPDGKFQSTPDIHQYRGGAQFTYLFNYRKYSYRAAIFQNEMQRRTAGSFMLRLEAFYRGLGVGQSLVPASLDNVTTYGDQAGLQYVKAPGLLAMPGYGATITSRDGKFFVAPMIFAGPGVAFNFYKGSLGDFAYTTWEFSSMAAINVGYNGPRMYFNFSTTGDVNYSPINPTYFMTTNLRMGITAGYRFTNFEKFIPGGTQ